MARTGKRIRKSFADYVAIMFAPMLIMTLVGSLIFFLLEATYEGQWQSRLLWVMSWFVFAAVLIGRISIERGAASASFLAMMLAGATGMWIYKFFGFVPIPFALLAFIWWATHKLTWDCTLIDDDEDASGEGLLQVAGVDNPEADQIDADDQDTEENVLKEARPEPERVPLWKRILFNTSERKGRAHSPGLWVILFSVLALPAFGFGQALIESDDTESRRFGFMMLVIYLASAMGLLLLTSFLGLRRYLRQRRMKMPVGVTATWLAFGFGTAAAVLLIAVLLPRPYGAYSITGLVDKVSEAVDEASDFAMLEDNGVDDEEGRQIGEGETGDDEGESGEGGSEGEEDKGEEGAEGEMTEESEDGEGAESKDAAEGEGDGEAGGDEGKTGGSGESGEDSEEDAGTGEDEESAEGESESKSMADMHEESEVTAGDIVKWILYALIFLTALFFAYKHRKALLDAWRRFLAGLFGRKKPEAVAAVVEEADELPPFSAYRNPFDTGTAYSDPPEEVIRYSFEAMQAWAKDRYLERSQDQTPQEFARILGESVPELETDAAKLTRIYSRIAYAGHAVPPNCLDVAQAFWNKLAAAARSEVHR